MINPGRYRARAVEAALGIADTGSEQVAVAFELIDGPHAGETATWFGYFSEKTRDSTLRSLRYCGWDGEDLADLGGVGRNDVELVIEAVSDPKGATRERVRWVNRVGGGLRMKHRMTPEQARNFADGFKRRDAASIGTPAVDGSTRTAEPNGQVSTGADVPF